MPVSTQQVKPLGSTLLLTCKVTLPDSGQEDVDYNLEWTALTNGVPRGINSRTGRFVLLKCLDWSHAALVSVAWQSSADTYKYKYKIHSCSRFTICLSQQSNSCSKRVLLSK